MKNLKTTKEVAQLLKIKEHRINYFLRTATAGFPKLRMAGRKLFTNREIKKIADYFGVEVPTEVSRV